MHIYIYIYIHTYMYVYTHMCTFLGHHSGCVPFFMALPVVFAGNSHLNMLPFHPSFHGGSSNHNSTCQVSVRQIGSLSPRFGVKNPQQNVLKPPPSVQQGLQDEDISNFKVKRPMFAPVWGRIPSMRSCLLEISSSFTPNQKNQELMIYQWRARNSQMLESL